MCCPYRGVGLWQNNSDKTNQRLNPSFCRGRHFIWHNDCERYGSAENRNVPSGRAGWICVPKSEISVFQYWLGQRDHFRSGKCGCRTKENQRALWGHCFRPENSIAFGKKYFFHVWRRKTKSCVCLCICHEPVHFCIGRADGKSGCWRDWHLTPADYPDQKRRTDGCYCRTPPIFPDGSDRPGNLHSKGENRSDIFREWVSQSFGWAAYQDGA